MCFSHTKVTTNAENNGQKIRSSMNVHLICFWMRFCWFSRWSCCQPHIFQSRKHYGREWLWNDQQNAMPNRREITIIKTHVSKSPTLLYMYVCMLYTIPFFSVAVVRTKRIAFWLKRNLARNQLAKFWIIWSNNAIKMNEFVPRNLNFFRFFSTEMISGGFSYVK